MSELATLARPYATAVFKRAKETATAAKWSEQLAFLASVLSDKAISGLVKNPKVKKAKLADLLVEIGSGHIDTEAISFLKLLMHNKRLDLLPTISSQFEALKAEHEGYVKADVFTAFAFTKEAEKKFAVSLERALSKKVYMNIALDKSLIGGVLVRAGDRVIDGSIKGQLQNLQKALL